MVLLTPLFQGCGVESDVADHVTLMLVLTLFCHELGMRADKNLAAVRHVAVVAVVTAPHNADALVQWPS